MNADMKAKLPKYKCHKEVRAAKITNIISDHSEYILELSGDINLLVMDALSVTVSQEWLMKRKPEVGGYFVVYEDGYESFSPAGAFEDGYTRIDETERIIAGSIGAGSPHLMGARSSSSLMKYCPQTGVEHPYPSEADQYRDYHRNVAWLFNPYTGKKRTAQDIGSDTFGYAIGAIRAPASTS